MLAEGIVSSFESEVAHYEIMKGLLKVYELISLKVLNDMLPTRKITDLYNVSSPHSQRIKAALGNGNEQ